MAVAASFRFLQAADEREVRADVYRYALATAFSGTAALGAGLTFSLRRRQRRAISREIRLLNEQADSIREMRALGCAPIAMESLRKRYQTNEQILAIDRELRPLSGAAPLVLIVPTAVASAGSFVTALWIYHASLSSRRDGSSTCRNAPWTRSSRRSSAGEASRSACTWPSSGSTALQAASNQQARLGHHLQSRGLLRRE